MTTNNKTSAWPMTADDFKAIERAAKAERARAMSAMGRSIVAALKRTFGGGMTTIYVPAIKGGRLTA
jgi:hypothetical protein